MLLVEVLQQQPAPPQNVDKKIIAKTAENQSTDVGQDPNAVEDEYQDEGDEGDELDSELDSEENEVTDSFPPDLAPIKKYYLIEKIKMLKIRLSEYNINNEDLDIVIKFMDSLSYNSLMGLSDVLIQSVEDQIVRLANGQKS